MNNQTSNKSNSISDRLAKCFSSVIHDVMRDAGFKNFVWIHQLKL